MLLAFLLGGRCQAQGVGSPKPTSTGSPYKVLRSVSGAAGHQDGDRYVMDDPRSVFTVGKDSKVTVYFEWEGPLGPHHFEGLWKSPEGRIVLISDFRYEAKGPRYSGYWSMLLTEGTPSGEWNIEARIDGEPAGMHSFVITGSPAAVNSSAPVVLSSADLYKKAFESTVMIEKLGADGMVLGRGTGFWVGDSQLLTAFDVIDSAASLRIRLHDGSQFSTDKVLAWNRWQDWAVLKTPSGPKAGLKAGSKDPLNVGDRCVFLEMGPVGAKLADGSITGKNTFPRAGDRLLVASGITNLSFGGPLLDEYGNYVGVLGGSILPGGDPIKTLILLSDPGSTGRPSDWETTGLVVPRTLLPDVAGLTATTSLSELAGRGELLSPVVKSDSFRSASLATIAGKERAAGFMPREYKRVFTRRDTNVTVYVNWQTTSKEKLNCIVRLYNMDNKLIDESKPREISLGPGKYVETTWNIPVNVIPSGIFRVDLVLNDKVSWRDFFRVAD
ncbi:MAG TPA: serine protease [Candidatus Angelobacter sp.]|nr:serine protease [Candidatus Angelobacter sp.]